MRPARQSPHLHQPPYSQGLNDYMLPPQAQPQQLQELFSRMDAMMAMISTTQQLALKNQTAHQQLQEKLDSLDKEIQELKTANTTATTTPDSGQKKLKIPFKLSVSL